MSLLKTSNLVFEQGHLSRKYLSRTIFASVNYLSSALVKENLSFFHLHYQGKLVKEKLVTENLPVCTAHNVSLTRGLFKENLLVRVNEAVV